MFLSPEQKRPFIYGCVFSLVMVLITHCFIAPYYFTHKLTQQNHYQLTQHDSHQASNNSLVNATNMANAPTNIDNDTEPFNKAYNDTVENTLHQDFSLLTNWRLLLNNKLTQQQMLAFSDAIPAHILNEINNDETLFSALLLQMQGIEQSQQRHFLTQILTELSSDKKAQAANELLQSARNIDHISAVSLMMSIEDDFLKTEHAQQLLQSQPDDKVLEKLLHHLSSSENNNVVFNIEGDLITLYQHTTNPTIKGLALQAMMKSQPDNINVLEQVSSMVSSNNPKESYQGLNILNQQLNDYGISLSEQQKFEVMNHLNLIADDNTQLINNRLKALESLAVLTNYY